MSNPRFISLKYPENGLSGKIIPVSSKSESNRALLLNALSNQPAPIHNLSASADTVLLQQLLERFQRADKNEIFNTENAGTVMRFLTAYCSGIPGKQILLTGSERMLQRPIGNLVTALQQLGARIRFEKKTGFPPLVIEGTDIKGGEVHMEAGTSSQFITALLLCAPTYTNGLTLHLEGELVSEPYINMTIDMMRMFDVTVKKEKNILHVNPQPYKAVPIHIENDWSAASYYYSLVALSETAEIILEGYSEKSLQGDAVVKDIYKTFGVITQHESNNIRITKTHSTPPTYFEYDFINCPDLAQTVAVTCAALGTEAKLGGLKTLKIKETDRVVALITELKKFGIDCEVADNTLHIKKGRPVYHQQPVATYGDHRMAMSFSAWVAKTGRLTLDDAEVVNKSYPLYWKHLQDIGISIK